MSVARRVKLQILFSTLQKCPRSVLVISFTYYHLVYLLMHSLFSSFYKYNQIETHVFKIFREGRRLRIFTLRTRGRSGRSNARRPRYRRGNRVNLVTLSHHNGYSLKYHFHSHVQLYARTFIARMHLYVRCSAHA